MCIILPLKVKKVSGDFATLEDGRIAKVGKIQVKSGDFVEAYADLVLGKITHTEARNRRELLKKTS